MMKSLQQLIIPLFAALLFSSLFSACTAGSNGTEKSLPENTLILDVRSPGEFSGGYIEGAVNIPFHQIDQTIESVEPDKNRLIIVYCQSGGRSAIAKTALTQKGYVNVTDAGSMKNLQRKIAE